MKPRLGKQAARRAEAAPRPSTLQGCLGLLSLPCLFVAILLVDTTRTAIGTWRWRDGYERTELEIVYAPKSGRGSVNLEARVLSTGTELRVHGPSFPELMRSENALGVTLDNPEKLKGRRVSVWFNPHARNTLWGDLRVRSAANGELPGLPEAAEYLAVLVGMTTLAVALARPVLRRRVSS